MLSFICGHNFVAIILPVIGIILFFLIFWTIKQKPFQACKIVNSMIFRQISLIFNLGWGGLYITCNLIFFFSYSIEKHTLVYFIIKWIPNNVKSGVVEIPFFRQLIQNFLDKIRIQISLEYGGWVVLYQTDGWFYR